MHALRHVHGLLVPGGTLVDIHPVTEEQVETGGRVLGVIEEPDWLAIDLPNAEEGVEQCVREGLYELEAETDYDVLEHFDAPEELVDAKWDLLEAQRSLVRRIEAASPPFVSRMHVVMRRVRVCSPGAVA